MNLRILKKLSKRAAPILVKLGEHREQFRAERDENYTGLLIRARKHYERGRSPHADMICEGEIKRPAQDGHGGYVYMHPPSHPRKGTVMVGEVSGYYEPEWSEETAYEALQQRVHWHFTEFDDQGEMTPTRRIRTPADVFQAATEMMAEPKNQFGDL